MTELFKKLNYKAQTEIFILDHPAAFEDELNLMRAVTTVKTDINNSKTIGFILTFVTTETEINNLVPAIDEKLKGDGILWFAFPKGTSKKYKSEIGRDKGWEMLRDAGFDTVRAVAIDEDWSALRFRRIEFIKNTTRR